MNALERAALAWWINKRPIGWTEIQHLDNPEINCTIPEQDLARRVAHQVRARNVMRSLRRVGQS